MVLAVFGAVTPAITRWIEPMTTPVRILAAVLLLFPAGLFMPSACSATLFSCARPGVIRLERIR